MLDKMHKKLDQYIMYSLFLKVYCSAVCVDVNLEIRTIIPPIFLEWE